MPTLQRRPRHVEDDDEQERPRQRQRRVESDDSDDDGEPQDDQTEDQLVKKLVRYALACEFSRTPIRRDGIREKVLGAHGRMFKKVFEGAQKQLGAVFGMEMVELPVRDKSTMSMEEQRKAAKSQGKSQLSSNTYILVTRLPEQYRTATIITPSLVQSAEAEASYIGLYSLIVTVITLNRGELSDQKLRRYLQRMNASVNTPVDKTEVLLQKLGRHGYIVKTVDRNAQGDEDTVTWHVGPRGKQEVTEEAMASIVREVYGDAADNELETRLQTSLKIQERKPAGPVDGDAGRSQQQRREGGNTQDEDDDEEDEDE